MYPHIVSIFNSNSSCDFCTSKVSKKIEIVANIGYYCCNSETCQTALIENINNYVISIEELRRKFGNKIKVKRSSGVVDDGWEFVSSGYISNEKSSYIIKVRKDNNSKEIRYTDVEELNDMII